MFSILQGPLIKSVYKDFPKHIDYLKKNKDFLKQLILYFEIKIWGELEKHKKIETYMTRIDNFRKDSMKDHTIRIFSEILKRLRLAESSIKFDQIDKVVIDSRFNCPHRRL